MSTRFIFAIAVAASIGTAHASTVDVSATVSGCSVCSGVSQATPGTFLGDIFSPVQLTLGPGSYSVTNAATTGTFSAWNFQGYPTTANWVWSFIMAADNGSGTAGTVILDDYIAGTYSTQTAAAGATGIMTYDNLTVLSGTSTAGFVDSFALATTTTLDFLIDDYILSDNGGGVALNITATSGVPEPASFLLVALSLLAIGGFLRCYKN
jgi:hypothetical protein